jgi:hypothetical protein
VRAHVRAVTDGVARQALTTPVHPRPPLVLRLDTLWRSHTLARGGVPGADRALRRLLAVVLFGGVGLRQTHTHSRECISVEQQRATHDLTSRPDSTPATCIDDSAVARCCRRCTNEVSRAAIDVATSSVLRR